MVGRGSVVASVLGAVGAHQLPTLPSLFLLAGATAGVALVLWAVTRRWPAARVVLPCCAGLWAGFCITVVRADARLAETLALSNVDRVSRVVLRIESLPRLQPDRVSFDASVLESRPQGVPSRIRVGWSASGWRSPYAAPGTADPPFPELRAGQIWRMALVLRPVRSQHNVHAFDHERHLFAAGIRAQGTVRGQPQLLRSEDWSSLSLVAERARHVVREAMSPYLQGLRYGAVLRALAIGDQDGVDDGDWRVFNRTGLTHLISISGSHITMLAGFAALAGGALWRRVRWRGRPLCERWPARQAAACAALLVAWLYCLLAGWGVPAQRTFLMLAVVALAQLMQLRLSGSRVLALAAALVLVFDPWAVLASGFWLSFMAVGVLIAVSTDFPGYVEGSRAAGPEGSVEQSGRPRSERAARWGRTVMLAARLQWAVTWALAPALAWLFHEVSLTSPLANAYAIPLVEMLVTPLSLLLAGTALVPGLGTVAGFCAWSAHGVLTLMMHPTEWLARLPSIPVAAAPAALYLFACAGAVFALQPRRNAGRWRLLGRWRQWGWLALLPLCLWRPAAPPHGGWDLHAFDVGQGSALLLRTARHAVLFDAGARHARDSDEGARTIVPALRALGVRGLDALIVSHADLDHAGGTRSVLAGLPVEQTLSSFDLVGWLHREAGLLSQADVALPRAASPCRFGDRWRVDGVTFEFLWPLDVQGVRTKQAANGSSCVLRVTGMHHALLLTGDIDVRAEAALVDRGLEPVDLVVAAHHGSRTSSSGAFVTAVATRHVIIQAGSWNRHGHPDPAVLSRWSESGARLWRTDWQGGIVARSRADGLAVSSALEASRRYWHGLRP